MPSYPLSLLANKDFSPSLKGSFGNIIKNQFSIAREATYYGIVILAILDPEEKKQKGERSFVNAQTQTIPDACQNFS